MSKTLDDLKHGDEISFFSAVDKKVHKAIFLRAYSNGPHLFLDCENHCDSAYPNEFTIPYFEGLVWKNHG